jgi:hypothetical protein
LVIVRWGVTAVITVVAVIVVISSIELSVRKESLCLLYMLFLICYNRQLQFVNKGSKVVRWVRDCISIYWYSLVRSDNFIIKEVYSL